MSTLSGGYAKVIQPTAPGMPCVHCGRDVNVAPYGYAKARLAKFKPVEKDERERRQNPDRMTTISRVICSHCYKEGKR